MTEVYVVVQDVDYEGQTPVAVFFDMDEALKCADNLNDPDSGRHWPYEVAKMEVGKLYVDYLLQSLYCGKTK